MQDSLPLKIKLLSYKVTNLQVLRIEMNILMNYTFFLPCYFLVMVAGYYYILSFLFKRETEKEREKERVWIWYLLVYIPNACIGSAGPGQSQVSRTLPRSPTWVLGIQALLSPSATFLVTLTRSCIGSSGVRNWTTPSNAGCRQPHH